MLRPTLLSLAAAALLSVLIVAFGVGTGSDHEPPRLRAPVADEGEHEAPADRVSVGRYIYALPLPALRGLPPDARPGMLMELWATWEPPLTDEPTVQRLLEGVRLHRIAPAVDPSSPDVALLDVAEEDVPDLIYADRYGSLNAALAPDST